MLIVFIRQRSAISKIVNTFSMNVQKVQLIYRYIKFDTPEIITIIRYLISTVIQYNWNFSVLVYFRIVFNTT